MGGAWTEVWGKLSMLPAAGSTSQSPNLLHRGGFPGMALQRWGGLVCWMGGIHRAPSIDLSGVTPGMNLGLVSQLPTWDSGVSHHPPELSPCLSVIGQLSTRTEWGQLVGHQCLLSSAAEPGPPSHKQSEAVAMLGQSPPPPTPALCAQSHSSAEQDTQLPLATHGSSPRSTHGCS